VRGCDAPSRILWVVTGSGAWLRASAGLAIALSRIHEVTVAFTRAGYEVARVFGLLGLYRLAAPGGPYRELIVESSASGAPLANRVASRRYRVVVVAPASSNTIAKLAHGIADSLASTIVNQALKSKTPVVVLAGEAPGGVETELPCRVDRGACIACNACIAACPVGAVYPVEDGKPTIDLRLCVGCRRCEAVCPVGAVRCFERARVEPTPLDLENLERLSRVPGVHLVYKPSEILSVLSGLGLCTPGRSRL
jgi:dihydromethanopterin reductase (acceptor)